MNGTGAEFTSAPCKPCPTTKRLSFCRVYGVGLLPEEAKALFRQTLIKYFFQSINKSRIRN